jgi:hypothetical protein
MARVDHDRMAPDHAAGRTLTAYRDKVRLRADTGLRLLSDDQFAAGLAALDLLVLRRSG